MSLSNAQPSPWPRRLLALGALLALAGTQAVLQTLQGLLGYRLRGPENLALVAYTEQLPWYVHLGLNITESLPLLVSLPLAYLIALRFPLTRGRSWRGIVVNLGAIAIALPALHILLSGAVRYATYIAPADIASLADVYRRLLSFWYYSLVVMYAGAAVVLHAWLHYRASRRAELETARLREQAAELHAVATQARLDALSAQLQPHFLFNTLNSVSVLARQGQALAVRRTIQHLAQLLRASLDRTTPVQTLRAELRLLRHYVAVEQVRFGPRLSIRYRIAPDCLNASVPVMLLQPLVENAVRHGIARVPGLGRIVVRAERRDAQLRLTVRNTSGSGHRTPGAGIGLANTRARLQQLYHDRHYIRLAHHASGWTTVTVVIPFHAEAVELVPAGAIA